MKGFLLLLLLVLAQYATAETCENISLPKSIEDCKDGDTEQSKKCCYVSFKSSGKYYAMCISMPDPEGNEWENEYDELKDIYSKVKADCHSSSIQIGILSIVGFLALIL